MVKYLNPNSGAGRAVCCSKSFFLLEDELNWREIEIYKEKYIIAANQYAGLCYDYLGVKTDAMITFDDKHQTINEKFKDGLFIYGLGGYVSTYVMPNLRQKNRIACVDYVYKISKEFKEKNKFKNCYLVPSDSYELIRATKTPYIIIATYHSDHARLAHDIFHLNKSSKIFVEKPPCVTLKDLDLFKDLFNKNASLDFGFNRRRIKANQYIKSIIHGRKSIITISVKEVLINASHWYNWENQGTRVTGNLVHWIDLANFWLSSKPVEINMLSGDSIDDFAMSLLYEDNSIVNISCSDIGNSMRGVQENIEIRTENETVEIDDYLKVTHVKPSGKKKVKNYLFRDKGHKSMYEDVNRFFNGHYEPEYTFTDLVKTTIVTYYASKMVKEKIRNMKVLDEINKYLFEFSGSGKGDYGGSGCLN